MVAIRLGDAESKKRFERLMLRASRQLEVLPVSGVPKKLARADFRQVPSIKADSVIMAFCVEPVEADIVLGPYRRNNEMEVGGGYANGQWQWLLRRIGERAQPDI